MSVRRHVTSRSDRRENIVADDEERVALLGIVEQGQGRFEAQMLAYCLTSNKTISCCIRAARTCRC